MSTACPVTGRTHRTARELRAELARLDAQRASLDAALAVLLPLCEQGEAVSETAREFTYDAVNALHGAVTALEFERREVEANPRTIPAGEAGTYALVCANID